MARRRRNRGAWFPNVGTSGPTGQADDDDAGIWGNLTPINNISQTFVTDLTFDQPVEDEADNELATKTSLADLIGSSYILKRIVGKLFVAFDGSTQVTDSQGALVTAGFFVARSEDSTAATVNAAAPIGAETAAELRENYSPAVPSTVREPWIWRRRWILGNVAQGDALSVKLGITRFPATNVGYGSVMDGPHIDQKTIRRVSNDDRLWFAISGRQLDFDFTDPFNPDIAGTNRVIRWHLDYRLFGRLTSQKHSGAF